MRYTSKSATDFINLLIDSGRIGVITHGWEGNMKTNYDDAYRQSFEKGADIHVKNNYGITQLLCI